MSAKYMLRYLPIAQDDLLAIYDYVTQDSPARALMFVDKLDERIGRLEHHPLLGRMPRHARLRQDGYRVLIIDTSLLSSHPNISLVTSFSPSVFFSSSISHFLKMGWT